MVNVFHFIPPMLVSSHQQWLKRFNVKPWIILFALRYLGVSNSAFSSEEQKEYHPDWLLLSDIDSFLYFLFAISFIFLLFIIIYFYSPPPLTLLHLLNFSPHSLPLLHSYFASLPSLSNTFFLYLYSLIFIDVLFAKNLYPIDLMTFGLWFSINAIFVINLLFFLLLSLFGSEKRHKIIWAVGSVLLYI